MSNLLSVENLTMQFGGLTAIDNLSFDAKNNEGLTYICLKPSSSINN